MHDSAIGRQGRYGWIRLAGGGPGGVGREKPELFLIMLLVTLVTGAAAFYSKWSRRQIEGSSFPWATAGVLALTVGLLLAFLAGLLKI